MVPAWVDPARPADSERGVRRAIRSQPGFPRRVPDITPPSWMLDTAPRPITTRSRRRSRASAVSIFVVPEYAVFLDSHSVGTACSPFAGASGDTASDDIRYSDMGFIGSLYRLQTNGQFTASVVVDATRGRGPGVGLCGDGPVCPGTRGSEGFRTHRRLPGSNAEFADTVLLAVADDAGNSSPTSTPDLPGSGAGWSPARPASRSRTAAPPSR